MKRVASHPRSAGTRWRVAREPDRFPATLRASIPRHSGRPAAYTLLELLLVLAVILAVAGAVTPTVVERMGDYKLKRGSEMARSAISSARIHAIDLSSVYQFRFEAGGRRYLAIPTDTEALITSQTGSAAAASAPGALPSTAIVSGQLPEDLSFQPVVIATLAPGATAATGVPPGGTDPAWTAAFAHVPNSGDYASASWSAPVLFRPDGSAMEAAVNVVDKKGDGFQLRVRELTGEVTVTRLATGTQ
jgi:type II secretory pathway pseudopilin PulG